MRACIGVILLAVMVWPGAAWAQFYRYVDNHGHVRFTDDINQVPEKQRTRAQSYSESQSAETPPPADAAEPTAERPGVQGPLSDPAAVEAAAEGAVSIDEARVSLDAQKKEVEAEYQALMKEKERLAKERDSTKTRDEVNAHNKSVEAFNQRAVLYEQKSDAVRKLIEAYNARVAEANARPASARK